MAGLQSAARHVVLSQLWGSAPQWTAALQHPATTRKGFCSSSSSLSSPGATAAESPEPSPSTSSGVPKVVVFGGRGFVGTHVCREALSVGLHVLAISPSGTPPVGREPWTSEVEWVRGNALEPKTYAHHLPGALGAVSCIGAFGTQEHMLKINGAANVAAIETAKAAGVPRFAFISAHIPNVPGIELLLQGYVRGKQAAEEALRANFPTSGVAIRPGVIYGNRVVSSSITLPLQFAFQPVEMALSYIPNAKQLSSLPLLGAAFVPPVSVEVVARAAVNAATGGDYTGGVLDVWDLAKFKQ